MIFELLNAGLLADENGNINNRMRSKILELLGYGIWEQGQDISTLQRNKAQKENIECLNNNKEPMVEDIDDHNIHVVEHTAFLLTDTIDDSNKEHQNVKEMLLKHIQSHKDKLTQNNLTIV